MSVLLIFTILHFCTYLPPPPPNSLMLNYVISLEQIVILTWDSVLLIHLIFKEPSNDGLLFSP